jgi:Ser/Thr protein kinase RdoA (MazF antagonist)
MSDRSPATAPEPVESAVLADASADCVLRAYDIGEPLEVAELSGGMFLRPVRIRTSRGAYVLRAHTFRDRADSFRFQAEATEHAANLGIRCARVVRRLDGRWGVRRAGAFWALHEYADGAIYDWPAWVRMKRHAPQTLTAVGAAVARLHGVLQTASPGGTACLPIHLPPVQFQRLGVCARLALGAIAALPDPTSSACPETVRALRDPAIPAAWHRLRRAALRLRVWRLPRQVVHGDISPVNLVFPEIREQGPARPEPSFIDWDCVHVGLRGYDALGDVLLRAPWNEPRYHTIEPNEIATYLRGYDSAACDPLTPHERACVPLFLTARQLEDIRQRTAVAVHLAPQRDEEYAALVRMRVAFLDQLAPFVENLRGADPWL